MARKVSSSIAPTTSINGRLAFKADDANAAGKCRSGGRPPHIGMARHAERLDAIFQELAARSDSVPIGVGSRTTIPVNPVMSPSLLLSSSSPPTFWAVSFGLLIAC
jgi:hypothetical protein